MDSITFTAFSTGLLVLVGLAQVLVLITQKRQSRLELVNFYQNRWFECKIHFGKVVYVGRAPGEYYQVLNAESVQSLDELIKEATYYKPTVWAHDSIQVVCSLMNEVSIRILKGQLTVSDAYPIFGSELLRQSRPLRNLLDTEYTNKAFQENMNEFHERVQKEMQDWLIYHDGLRRRCLILMDLLWAEAVRLEDLPPYDVKSAAEAKIKSGKLNKSRVFNETLKLNGLIRIYLAWQLSRFLGYAEYRSGFNWKGIDKFRLKKLESIWVKRLLRE